MRSDVSLNSAGLVFHGGARLYLPSSFAYLQLFMRCADMVGRSFTCAQEGLSGGCKAGLTLERCRQLAAFAIQPVG